MHERRWILPALLAVGCGWFSTAEKLSGSDCKPRKLKTLTSCTGEDRSFQECSFYHRATGAPDRSWCMAMPSVPPAGGALARCTWDSTIGWTPVPCAPHNIHGGARCFACVSGGHEETRTYVFAYDPACQSAVEQVTCNVDPGQAGIKLGATRL